MEQRQSIILIVDDYQDALEAVALGLRLEGFFVETASSGLDAVQKAHSLLPDTIVMDCACQA